VKKRYWFWIAVAVTTVGTGLVVYFAAHDVIRAAVARAYTVIHTLANAIPQPVYLILLLLAILISAARSLVEDEGRGWGRHVEPAGGRAEEWREWLEQAGRPAPSQQFYRWRVARNLARLASEVVAHEQGIVPGEAERLIEDGDVVLPAAIRSYFLGSMRSRPALAGAWWERLPRVQPSGPLDMDPHQAVEWIENQMEAPYDNRHP